MTQRERLEAKIEKRQEWANGRRQKATSLYARREPYNGDIAFWTQPGHIPERARVIAAIDKSFEHSRMAAHHEAKADGLADQLERTVFSDDDNAITALEARIAEHEAQRERMKRINMLYKKGDALGLAALGLDLDTLKAKLAEAGPYWGSKPHLPYELTNLGARIRADRERIAEIQTRRERNSKAGASGGVLIEGAEWIRVTFAEKPSRSVLDALKAAGFRWGRGSWCGERAKLPDGVA